MTKETAVAEKTRGAAYRALFKTTNSTEAGGGRRAGALADNKWVVVIGSQGVQGPLSLTPLAYVQQRAAFRALRELRSQ